MVPASNIMFNWNQHLVAEIYKFMILNKSMIKSET